MPPSPAVDSICTNSSTPSEGTAWRRESPTLSPLRQRTRLCSSVAVARAEDLIIYKAVAFRPQDQQDIERLLVLHHAHLNLDRIRQVVSSFALALNEPDRMRKVEEIIRRTHTGDNPSNG